MSKFSKALFYILMTAFILTLVGPFITTGLFTVTMVYYESDIAFVIMSVSLFSAISLLPMLGFTFFNALGCVTFWIEIIDGPMIEGNADFVCNALVTVATFILLLLPVIGMCLIKKSPKLFRALVYIPLIISMAIKLATCEPISLMSDFIYLGLVVILDVCIDRY